MIVLKAYTLLVTVILGAALCGCCGPSTSDVANQTSTAPEQTTTSKNAEALTWLDQQADKMRADIASTEQEIERLRQGNAAENEILRLTRQLEAKKNSLNAVDARIAEVRDQS